MVGFSSPAIFVVAFHHFFFHPFACDSPPGGLIVGSSFPDDVLMSQAFISRLKTSLNCSAGLPMGLDPRDNSPSYHHIYHHICLIFTMQ